MSSRRYTFGEYTLLDSGRVLERQGEIVPVTPKVLATLAVLVRASGQVVSKEDLLKAVWPDSFVEEGNLTQNISVLRKLMARDYPDGGVIETIPRLGYRFRPEIQAGEEDLVGELAPVALPPVELIPSGSQVAIGPAWKRFSFAMGNGALRNYVQTHKVSTAAVLLLLAVAGVGISIAVHRNRVSAASIRVLHPRIAVLAFTNLSQSADAAWLAGALRETLATDLGTDKNLRVIANDNVERAERELRLSSSGTVQQASLGKLCDDLDCDQVITGTYLLNGGKVRLDARLVDANSGKVLGSYTLVKEQGDLLPLISETGAAIRANLGSQAASAEDRRTVRAGVSESPEAYRLYIEGLERARSFDGRAAVDLLTRAIQLDPNFPLAHHALSGAYAVLGIDGKAVHEAKLAESLSGALSRREQLEIAAGLKNTERKYLDAAEVYRALFTMFPDDLDYGRLRASELCHGGQPQQGLDLLRGIMAPGTPETREPRMYLVASDCYGVMGDWASSQAVARTGAEESLRRGAKVVYDRLLTSESQAMLYTGQLQPALALTREALAVAQQFQDYSGELRALNRLGQIRTAMNDLPAAQKVLEEALAREEQLGEMSRQIPTLSALGQNLQKQGDRAQAAVMFQRGLTMAKDFEEQEFIAEAELNLGRLEMQSGNLRAGKERLLGVMEQAARLNNRQLAEEASNALRPVAVNR